MSWTLCACMNAYIGEFREAVEAARVPRTPAHTHLSNPRKGESPVLFIRRLPSCVPLTCFSIHFSLEERALALAPAPNSTQIG